jgi:hypothetical protein
MFFKSSFLFIFISHFLKAIAKSKVISAEYTLRTTNMKFLSRDDGAYLILLASTLVDTGALPSSAVY